MGAHIDLVRADYSRHPSFEIPGLDWHGLAILENIHSPYYIYGITIGATILYHFFFVVYFLLPFREANIEVEFYWISSFSYTNIIRI